MCLIQIGSGSASLDTNIQDGFSNYVISNNIEKKDFYCRSKLYSY
jgi:hypothetical protein